MTRTASQLAAVIDHTLLKPEASAADVARHVEEAAKLGTLAVCVSPNQLPLDAPEGLTVAAVVGFPSGAHHSSIKAAEAARAVADGADEIDMVAPLGAATAGDIAAVEADIRAVREATRGAVLKVILESAALSEEELRECCLAAERAGADFVKTSTGFHPSGGATVEAVRVMADAVGGRLGIKASGGIRDVATAEAMLDAGATRLGCSGSAALLAEAAGR